jgi:DNA-binding transcriptional MocR family regulator
MRVSGRTADAIAASIERQLREGSSEGHTALPPVRELAARLKVSPATVAAAYRVLRARGLVAGEGRRGTRVVSTSPPGAPPVDGRRSAIDSATVDLASGNPDPTLLPPLDTALASLRPSAVLYGGPAPDRELVAFAGTEFAADDIPATALAVVSGAFDGIERILREHLRAGDRVAIEDPSFPGVIDLVRASGLTPVPCAIDDEGPRPEALAEVMRRGCGAFVVTPRAQNPTGAALTSGRAAELRRMLLASDMLVVENDYASAVAGAPAITLCGGPGQRWAVVRSTGKFLGPDLRVALMAGDEVTIGRVRHRQTLGARWVSHILQRLVVALWSDPASGRRLARASEVYAQRRSSLVAALASRGIAAHGRSGFNVWVGAREESSVVSALAERGWAVASGDRFRIQAAPGIRVTTATLDPHDAERFAADLVEALRPGRTSTT